MPYPMTQRTQLSASKVLSVLLWLIDWLMDSFIHSFIHWFIESDDHGRPLQNNSVLSVVSWKGGGGRKFFLIVRQFSTDAANFGAEKSPFWWNLRAKLEFWAIVISSVGNFRLSVRKLQLPAPATFLPPDATEYYALKWWKCVDVWHHETCVNSLRYAKCDELYKLSIPPHLKCVATLPCKIQTSQNRYG